jgi:DNA topoisomerase II
VNYVLESIQKKNKKLTIKSHNVKQHLWIFVNCLIENPSFDSQTKENMTLKPSSFGSSFEFSEKFLKDVIKTGIVDHCVSFAKAREELKMTKQLNAGGKKTGRLLGIPKLDDANNAGTRNSHLCTLILTEGDSAKSLAMSGIEIVGRDNFGVFPLRGKLLNVREATNLQITNNEEIQNLIKILGLQVGKTYEEVKNLRYGSIMIMTDQDHDGSHIKGLIINFIHHFWPSLIKMNGFLKEFITPIIKATKGSETRSFYTIPEYKKWVDSLGGNVKNWNIKYYKGLGTSTQREAQEYFSQIVKHKIEFLYQNEQDDESIDLAFNKKKAEDRKNWLANFDINDALQDSLYTQLKYEDFINKEFILFSMADNLRSIPSVCDGLKPSERKILFACFKKKLKGEIKVAQLTGYVSEHSAYHHGEQSLSSTIVAMAQNFVGSNNVNLLMPIGMFGTRNYGGKDSASARYIFTSLSKVTRHIYNENDDPLMDFIIEEGQRIEPHWYLPTLPMVLVNGAEGIGTGWSTNIPCYNPREIIDNIKHKMKTGSFFEMKPWYKGFLGTIEKSAKKDNYTVTGKFEWNDDTLVITELPLKKWTKDYNEYLESLMGIEASKKDDKDKKKDKKKKNEAKEEEDEPKVTVILEDIRQYHTNNRVHFEVKFLPEYLDEYKDNPNKVIKTFKLQKNLACTNMVCFDKDHKLKRYNEVEEILEEFFDLRLEYYTKRKEYMLSHLKRDLEILDNKVRFIILIIDDKLVVRKKKKTEIINEMYKLGFTPMSKINQIKIASKSDPEIPVVNSEENPNEEEEEEGAVRAKEYDYLLSMPLWSLTIERVNELLKNKDEKTKEIQILNKTDEKDIWQNDMAEFLRVLEEVEIKEEEDRLGGNKLKKANAKGAAAKKPRAKNKPKDDLTDEEAADKKVNQKKQNEKVLEKTTTKGEKAEKPNKTEKKLTGAGGKSNGSGNPFLDASQKIQESKSKVTEAPPDLSKLSLKERLALKTKRKIILLSN